MTGVVTVEPGRILGEHYVAIQDASGGIIVRLPDEVPTADLSRGRILQVQGELAAPYGNLELRPGKAAQISFIGSGGLPDPVQLRSSAIGETTEGLLARLAGTVVDIDKSSSGTFSFTLRDDRGTARVYAYATTGLDSSDLERGRAVTVTGIVGQRASRSGAADGYRLWPRGVADLVVAAAATPTPTSRPGDDDDSDDSGDGGHRRTRIKDAAEGETVTIVGTVTSAAGFIDSEGRRVTVQDASGAILVRFPEGVDPARVGQVIRARGEVGTWYDGRQLEAETAPRRLRDGRALPTILRRPPIASDEWQLVSVTVRIEDVERSGDTWRAEATLGAAGKLPIAGLSGSGTSADGLEPGRSARIVGIVKRAHPSATDQRFAIAPRSPADIQLGRTAAAGDAAGEESDTDASGDDESQAGLPAGDGSEPDVTLAALADFEGQRVRVGGRLSGIRGLLLTLDDGTATARVRLPAEAEEIRAGLAVGDVVNAVGRVRARDRAEPEVVVRTAADVTRAADLQAPESEAPTAPAMALLSASLGGELAHPPATGDPREPGGGVSGSLWLVVISAALAAAAAGLLGAAVVLRRWPTMRLRARRLTTRLRRAHGAEVA